MNSSLAALVSIAARVLRRVVRNPVEAALWYVGAVLARAGLVDARRAKRTTELAWPRIVTGIARTSQSAADLAMIGAAVGTTAVAAVGIATPFAFLAGTLGAGVAGGTISLVSQRFGADRYDELDLVIKQSVWVTLVLCLPLAAALRLYPVELVALVANDPETVDHGADYLRVMSVATVFVGLNLIGSRTLVGADDAYSAMVARGTGAVANVGLNAAFIFGLEMGVIGAALGSVLANALTTAIFAYGLLGGRLPYVGTFPVTVTLSGPYLDAGIARDLVTIATPVVFTNLVRSTAQFPLLAIVATFGPEVVAAFVVARRVRGLIDAPSWGLKLASSSLVGQHLGRADEREADAYGWDIIRITVAIYVLVTASVIVFAEPIARVFVDDPSALPTATTFVRVAAVSVFFYGIDGSAAGPLTASGDTRWPFYGRMLGLYGFAIPIAYAGTVVVSVPGLGPVAAGIAALYVAFVAETLVPAAVSCYRFSTGRWKTVSRSYRPDAAASD